ncbi:MAG: hypothetical protein GC168_03510 [Candidatus Hydrogenedens sp.]|nr:hypothetical protein [Candidatus Hydrogenedens sp.]
MRSTILKLVFAGLLLAGQAFAGSTDNLEILSSFSIEKGRIGIEYRVTSLDYARFNLQATYDAGGFGLFRPATEANGSDGTTNLTSSPDGIVHVFVWDLVGDLGRTTVDSVQVELVISTGNRSPIAQTTNDFEVDTFVLERKVQGIVYDSRTGATIPSATVEAFNSGDKRLLASSPLANSIYTLNTGTLEPVDLLVTADGYEPLRIERVLPPLSLPLRLRPDTPAAPDVTSAAVGVDEVQVRWTPADEDNLVGYNVYRNSGNEFVQINVAPVQDTVFEDLETFVGVGAKGGSPLVTYGVKAVHESGKESELGTVFEQSTDSLSVIIPTVEVPVGGLARIPINVRNASGISVNGLDIAIRYTPETMLAGRVESTAVTSNVAFLANVNFNPSLATQGLVDISGITTDILQGEGHLFDVYLQLNQSVRPGTQIPVAFDELKFYDAFARPVPVEGISGVIVVGGTCREGDINQDSSLDSNDVFLATQIILGQVSSNACQRRALDLNGDGRLDTADVVLLRRLVLGNGLNPGSNKDSKGLDPVDVTLEVGSLSGLLPGDEISVPITVSEGQDITGFDLALAFDDHLSSLVFKRIDAGDFGADLLTNVLVSEGLITISGSADIPLNAGPATLVNVVFDVAESIPGEDAFPLTLTSFSLYDPYGGNFQWDRETIALGGTLITSAVQPSPSLIVTVVDECAGTPIAGANVTYVSGPTNLQRTTSASGVAVFEFVSGGAFSVTATFAPRQRIFAGSGLQNLLLALPPQAGDCAAPSPTEFLDNFSDIDTNGDGKISQEEAQNYAPGLGDTAFHERDYDADGGLTVAELFQVTEPPPVAVGDYNGDLMLSLSEVLRIIQLYNAQGYSCAANPGDTEDGYRPIPNGAKACKSHTADYTNPQWKLTLSELLRVLQVYSWGSYHTCESGEGDDGFCL